MSVSMYQASVPVFLRMLGNLAAVLEKGAAHAEAHKIDPAVFITDRLAPDMLPLARQVQIAGDSAVRGASRLAGIDFPSYPDNETTFGELLARLAKSRLFLETLTADQIDGSKERPVTVKLRTGDTTFAGQAFLLNFVLPNFYFHITTTYLILRHNGVDLGKADYLGGR